METLVKLKLTVHIDEHQVTIHDCDDCEEDVKRLIEQAAASYGVITITVHQNPENAAILGRLIYGRPQKRPVTSPALEDAIDNLSLPLRNLEMRPMLKKALRWAGIHFIWQLVEMKSMDEVLKLKSVGKRGGAEISDILHELGLDFGMNIDDVRDRLPTHAIS